MSKLSETEDQVKEIYRKSEDNFMRTWFFENHVKVVVDYADKIAKEAKADSEICVLSALFHDIARPLGFFDEPQLMEESLMVAEEMMEKQGYTKDKVQKVMEAIIPHSCNDKLPTTLEGKILATADALAHLMTDFYLLIGLNKWIGKSKDTEKYREWVLEKIERDFKKKIFFDPWKQKAEKRYNAIKLVFSQSKQSGS